jgi:hypothetical protein
MSLKKRTDPTSLSKIKANRTNALKSTGPRSIRGKNQSKWNALKHGLLAKEVLITVGDAQEKVEDFNELLEALCTEYLPVGPIEHMLVEKIAVSYWRQKRAVRAEVGQIQKKAANGRWDYLASKHASFYDKVFAKQDPENRFDTYTNMVRDVRGLKSLIEFVERVREEIQFGELGGNTISSLEHFYSRTALREILAKGIKKSRALKLVDEELSHLRTSLKDYGEKEAQDATSELMASMIPDGDRADVLLRYETAIERQLYRAIRELLSLQQIRLQGISNK